MPWRVDVSPRARRELVGLGAAERAAMNTALERLAVDPSSVDFRKLAGGAGWRLRVGQWRAIINLDTRAGVMRVQRVLNRRDAYR